VELHPYQDLRIPLDAGFEHAFDCLALMVAEVRPTMASMSIDERCLCLDELQNLIDRPELLRQRLEEAGLTALRRYLLAFVDPRYLQATAPPPKAA
jgi:hypothetical protein